MEHEKRYVICVVGSANSDAFLEVPHFPLEGETLQTTAFYRKNGGKGANQACAAAKLKVPTAFAGQIGNDTIGDALIDELKTNGCDCSLVRKHKTAETGQAFITVNAKGENNIILVGGANMEYESLTELPEEYVTAITRSVFVMLQNEIPQEINILVAKKARELGKQVILDCGGRDEPFKDEFLQNIDFISPNETELARLLNRKETDEEIYKPEFLREHLLKKFPDMKIILKLGARGSAYLDTANHLEVASVSKLYPEAVKEHPIVDTTGAGDCFLASFFACLSTNQQDVLNKFQWSKLSPDVIQECLYFANCSAYLCCSKKGAMPAMPTHDQLMTFMKKYSNLH